jgi:hypothetical protein
MVNIDVKEINDEMMLLVGKTTRETERERERERKTKRKKNKQLMCVSMRETGEVNSS